MRFSEHITTPEDIPEFLEAHLRDLESEYGILLTVHDRLGWLRDSAGEYLLPGRNLHQHGICREQRPGNIVTDTACVDHCKTYVDEVFATQRTPRLFSCWKGVLEVAVPIYLGELHVLTLFAGSFRGTVPYDSRLPEAIVELQKNLPELSEQRSEVLSRQLYATGKLILGLLEELREHNRLSGGRSGEIVRYIQLNAHSADCCLDALAKELCLSSTRTRHVVKNMFGLSFQTLLIRERMARAKVLLTVSEAPLQEIANKVGISNVYYFSRLFHKYEGLPPGKFRRNCQEKYSDS